MGDELIYIGEGKGSRAFCDVRNKIWSEKVKSSKSKINVVIKGYFKNENDALLLEKVLIEEATRDGIKLTNIKHNLIDILKEYTLNVKDLKETTKEEINILNKNTNNIIGFYHYEKLYEDIKSILMKSENKVVIFADDRNKVLLDNLSKTPEVKMLYISNFNLENDEKMVKDLKDGLIPNPYNVLIYPINSLQTSPTIIKDKRVKLIVINTIINSKIIESLEKVKIEVETILYKYRVNPSEVSDYINISDKWLNIPLTTAIKRDLCDEINMDNNNGRELKWTTVKRTLKKQGYIIEDKIIVIDERRTRVSYIKIPKIAK